MRKLKYNNSYSERKTNAALKNGGCDTTRQIVPTASVIGETHLLHRLYQHPGRPLALKMGDGGWPAGGNANE